MTYQTPTGKWIKILDTGQTFLVEFKDGGVFAESPVFKPDEGWEGLWALSTTGEYPTSPKKIDTTVETRIGNYQTVFLVSEADQNRLMGYQTDGDGKTTAVHLFKLA